MEANIMLGKNLGTLDFTHFSTLRYYGVGGVKMYEKEIEKMFNGIFEIKQLNSNIEKGIDSYHHAHILLSLNDDKNSFDSILKYFNPINIAYGREKRLVKKYYPDSKSFKDTYIEVLFKKLHSKKSVFHIENVLSTTNASIYSYKFSSYGINSNYYCR